MITIIERIDVVAPTYPKQIRCQNCHSLLSYLKVDETLKAIPSLTPKMKNDPGSYQATGFICPVCNNFVIVG